MIGPADDAAETAPVEAGHGEEARVEEAHLGGSCPVSLIRRGVADHQRNTRNLDAEEDRPISVGRHRKASASPCGGSPAGNRSGPGIPMVSRRADEEKVLRRPHVDAQRGWQLVVGQGPLKSHTALSPPSAVRDSSSWSLWAARGRQETPAGSRGQVLGLLVPVLAGDLRPLHFAVSSWSTFRAMISAISRPGRALHIRSKTMDFLEIATTPRGRCRPEVRTGPWRPLLPPRSGWPAERCC